MSHKSKDADNLSNKTKTTRGKHEGARFACGKYSGDPVHIRKRAMRNRFYNKAVSWLREDILRTAMKPFLTPPHEI